jgi:GT2 family glycosyltransferase
MSLTVTAIVVSYNRAGLLQECLDALAAQTRQPDRVIVIDNASTDGAADVAEQHPLQPEVTVLDHNVGGAGGFCAGIARALADAAADHSQQTNHYVWLMDDDTIPTSTALEQLLAAAGEARERNGVWPAVLGSKALWTDGREHLMNKPRPRTWRALGAAKLQQSAEAFQVRSLSFVSCLINARMIESARALPRAAYFLWNDDYEYTTKLLRRATGYYVPASEVIHKTKVFGSSDADPGEALLLRSAQQAVDPAILAQQLHRSRIRRAAAQNPAPLGADLLAFTGPRGHPRLPQARPARRPWTAPRRQRGAAGRQPRNRRRHRCCGNQCCEGLRSVES